LISGVVRLGAVAAEARHLHLDHPLFAHHDVARLSNWRSAEDDVRLPPVAGAEALLILVNLGQSSMIELTAALPELRRPAYDRTGGTAGGLPARTGELPALVGVSVRS
jgi:hypothetical protein